MTSSTVKVFRTRYSASAQQEAEAAEAAQATAEEKERAAAVRRRLEEATAETRDQMGRLESISEFAIDRADFLRVFAAMREEDFRKQFQVWLESGSFT